MAGDSEGNRGWRLLELGGGAALLGLAATFAFLIAPEGESTSYALGSAFGSVIGGLLIAAALRWGWIRFGSGQAPVMAPALLLVAGVVSFLLALGSLGREAKQEDESLNEAVALSEQGAASCPDPLPGTIGDGLKLEALSGGALRRVEAQIAGYGPEAQVFEHAEYERAERDGRFVAVLTLIPFEGAGSEQNARDLVAGAAEGIAQQGLTSTPTTVAGQAAISYEAGPESIVVTTLDCHALFVNALGPEDATEVATAAVTDQL